MEPEGGADPIVGSITVLDGPPVTVTLAGEFDLSDADRLQDVFDGVADAAIVGQRVRLHLGDVVFCSSSVLSCLLLFHRRLESNGSGLDVVALSSVMHRLLEVTGTSGVLLATPPDR